MLQFVFKEIFRLFLKTVIIILNLINKRVSEFEIFFNKMDNKKGIRLKTKEVSLVDNIVSFFKKEP